MTGAETYTITIVKYGTRSTVKSDVFLNYGLYGEPDAPIEMDYFVWIVRNENRTVVVDTGFSVHGGQVRNRTTLLDLPDTYRLLGVDPAASPAVIITHAHYDHTGNLDHFPSSPIYLARSEYEFWTGHTAEHAQFHHSVEDADLAYLRRAVDENRVTLFDDSLELAPGIDIIRVGGHTPGQCIVKVATAEGVTLLASDAIHFYEEYERERPFTYVADLVAMYDSFDLIRQMEQSGEIVSIVSGHDAGTIERFTPVAGEPVDGALRGRVATIGAGASGEKEREK